MICLLKSVDTLTTLILTAWHFDRLTLYYWQLFLWNSSQIEFARLLNSLFVWNFQTLICLLWQLKFYSLTFDTDRLTLWHPDTTSLGAVILKFWRNWICKIAKFVICLKFPNLTLWQPDTSSLDAVILKFWRNLTCLASLSFYCLIVLLSYSWHFDSFTLFKLDTLLLAAVTLKFWRNRISISLLNFYIFWIDKSEES